MRKKTNISFTRRTQRKKERGEKTLRLISRCVRCEKKELALISRSKHKGKRTR